MNLNNIKFGVETQHLAPELDIMIAVLRQFDIPEYYYSIGSYLEEAICIENEGDKWIIYEGERGKKYNLKVFDSIVPACCNFLARISESEDQEKKMISSFKQKVVTTRMLNAVRTKQSFSKLYSESDAIALIKNTATLKYDEMIEMHIKTYNMKTHFQSISVELPHKDESDEGIIILVLAKGDKIKEAKQAGADYAGGEELVYKILDENWLEFDIVIATPDMKEQVAKLSKILGPRGLMPSYKAGTLTENITDTINDIRNRKIRLELDKADIIHVPVGKVSYSAKQLEDNIEAIIKAVNKASPKKVRSIQSVTLALSETSNVMEYILNKQEN